MDKKCLLPCFCIRDSLKFDMQYDIVLKNLNFDLLTPRVRMGVFGQTICYHVATLIPINLISNMTMF